MTRVSVKKGGKKKDEPTKAAPKDELDDDLGGDDLGDDLGGSDVGADDLGIDDDDLLGDDVLSETDDLGVSVEDVEDAMAGVPAGNVSSAASDAALAALTAEVAKVNKALTDMAKAKVSNEIKAAVDGIASSVDALKKGFDTLSAAVVEVRGMVDSIRQGAAPKSVERAAATTSAAAAAPSGDTAKLDAFLKTQIEGLTGGKEYPFGKVGDAFAKRIEGFTAEQIVKRLTLAASKSVWGISNGREGHFLKK